jgi:N-glycosylase/DNA lyase
MQLAAAVELLYWSDRTIRGLIHEADGAHEARRILVGEVPGLGPKQASLFLRNIGFTLDLAILDCHVLRYMAWQGTPELAEPPRSVKRYEHLEDLLRADADRHGVALGELDRAIWLVMRAWQGSVQ